MRSSKASQTRDELKKNARSKKKIHLHSSPSLSRTCTDLGRNCHQHARARRDPGTALQARLFRDCSSDLGPSNTTLLGPENAELSDLTTPDRSGPILRPASRVRAVGPLAVAPLPRPLAKVAPRKAPSSLVALRRPTSCCSLALRSGTDWRVNMARVFVLE